MPDTAVPTPTSWPSATAKLGRRDIDQTPVADRIRAERRPLPAHDLDGVNARQWALAVCGAEVKHRASDFSRVERAMGMSFDRWDMPYAEQQGQFDHEARAGEVLSIQGHLVTADGYIATLLRTLRKQREAGWDKEAAGTLGDLRAELHRRRTIWRQFLGALARYKAARREHDRVPTVARAA